MRRRIQLVLITALSALSVLCVSIGGVVEESLAASYSVTFSHADGSIDHSVNGFEWLTHGGDFSTYGGHCELKPSAAYVAGAFCQLRWNAPAMIRVGTTGGGGGVSGTYRVADPSWLLRTTRPAPAVPAYLNEETTQRATHGPFHHHWEILGAYVDTGLVTGAGGVGRAYVSNWFTADRFTVQLHDDHAPFLVDGHYESRPASGWIAPAPTCTRFVWTAGDNGSQLWSMRATNLTTGALLDSWQAQPGGPVAVSGVARNTRSFCVGGTSTGLEVVRLEVADRAGNSTIDNLNVVTDAHRPEISPVQIDSPAVSPGVYGSAAKYSPDVSWSVRDTHSGLASVAVYDHGRLVSTVRSGDTVRIAPGPWALGEHRLTIVAIDDVGNRAEQTVLITIVDDARPQLTLESPGATAMHAALLDVRARDDRSGIDPASWQVSVNGVAVPTTAAPSRLQLPLGTFVDGSHTLVIRVADEAGNVETLKHVFEVDTDPNVPQITGAALTGITVFESPSDVREGETYRIQGVFARAGRPVSGHATLATGTTELTQAAIGDHGVASISTVLSVPGPLKLRGPSGAGLTAATITYTFTPLPPDPAPDPEPTPTLTPEQACAANQAACTSTEARCSAHPGHPDCAAAQNQPPSSPQPPAPKPADPQPAAPATPPVASAASNQPPKNVVYYIDGRAYFNGVPVSESGSRYDKIPPRWRLTLKQRRAGEVVRTKRITFILRSNEVAVYTISPAGSTPQRVIGIRNKSRLVSVKISGKALKRLQTVRASNRPNRLVAIRMRIVGVDGNRNRSKPVWATFRIRP